MLGFGQHLTRLGGIGLQGEGLSQQFPSFLEIVLIELFLGLVIIHVGTLGGGIGHQARGVFVVGELALNPLKIEIRLQPLLAVIGGLGVFIQGFDFFDQIFFRGL